MHPTRSSISVCSSSSSEPGSPDFSPTLSNPTAHGLAFRRRSMLSSFSPSPLSLKKRHLLPDLFTEKMAPTVAVFLVALIVLIHFLIGLGSSSMPSLEALQAYAATDTAPPLRMSNADVVAELTRWRSPQYARERLRVFYYDLPPRFNQKLVEQSHKNPPPIRDPYCDENFYSAESSIAKFFKNSPVRTMNASEADFFYLPIYATCYLITNQPNNVTKTGMFFEEAMNVVINEFPYWNRSDGRDHIMMFAQGFGARLAGDWAKYRHATFLVHNGDYEEAHYDTHKDIVVPPDLRNYLTPVGLSNPERLLQKNNFVLFGGQVLRSDITDHRGSNYSGGVRQFIQDHLSDADGYRITGVRSTTYIKDMKESVFCLAPHGWHKWSPRPAYAILLGCIPVLISERQELFLEHLVDYSQISYWVRPQDVRLMDAKLRNLPAHELTSRELNLREVWRLFWYGEEGLAEQAVLYSLYRKLATSRLDRTFL